MKTKTILFYVLTFSLILISACDDTWPPLKFLNPLYNYKNIITNDLLQGEWWVEDKEPSKYDSVTKEVIETKKIIDNDYTWTITRDTSNTKGSYILIISRDTFYWKFDLYLVKIKEHIFADIQPYGSNSGYSFFNGHQLNAHSISKVEITADKIVLYMFSEDWLIMRSKPFKKALWKDIRMDSKENREKNKDKETPKRNKKKEDNEIAGEEINEQVPDSAANKTAAKEKEKVQKKKEEKGNITKEKYINIEHVVSGDGEILVTASTEKLQKFVTKYADKEDAFQKIVLVKAQ